MTICFVCGKKAAYVCQALCDNLYLCAADAKKHMSAHRDYVKAIP